MQLASSATGSAQALASSSAAQGSEQSLLASSAPDSRHRTNRIDNATRQQRRRQPARYPHGRRRPIHCSARSVNSQRCRLGLQSEHLPVCVRARESGDICDRPAARTGMPIASHEFIIRADGEVVSRDMNNGLWGNEFNDLRIYPGDTIVVPEKTSSHPRSTGS